MQSLETQCAVRAWRVVGNERGQDPVAYGVDLLRQDQVFRGGEEAARLSMQGAAIWRRPLEGRIGGVDNVHTLGRGLGHTGAGPARTRHVSGGVQCLQALEPGSSPTSGTVFPQFRGFLVFFSCGQCPHSRL